MHRLSMTQALSIWSDLEMALHGKNNYGGDTAEIYMSRLMERNSLVEVYARTAVRGEKSNSMTDEAGREAFRAANESLHNILTLFAKERGAGIEIEGKELGAWLRAANFEHRVHIRVWDLSVRQAKKSWFPTLLMTADQNGMPIGNFKQAVMDQLDELEFDPCTPIVFKAKGTAIEVHVVHNDED